MTTIKCFGFVLSVLMICSCSNENKPSKNDPILTCFEDIFKEKGADYHKNLSETIQVMNEIGFPIKSGNTRDLIEVLENMKDGSFPTDVNMESEAIYKELRIMSLAACALEFKHTDEATFKIVQKFDQIVVYDVNSKEQFDQMADHVINELLSMAPLPEWTDPFNIHMATLFYTQYWRINHQNSNNTDLIESDTLQDYPPPPVAPPPPVPEPIEVEIEDDDIPEDMPEVEQE